MTSEIIYYIIIIFVAGEYAISQWLDYRNRKAASPVLPASLGDLYDSAKYATQQNYFKTKNRFSFYSTTFETAIIILMITEGGFGKLSDACFSLFPNGTIANLVYFAVLFVAYELLTLPFDIYYTFVIEEKFGFNRTTPRTFLFDKLKELLLAFVFGGIILALIIYLYGLLGQNFWWAAFLVITAFSLIMTMFYSNIIVPLFNRQTPLPEGELRDKIEAFSKKINFPLTGIYVIDGSKRTTKANAYFSGLGFKKRIVLYDTLVDEFTGDELLSVLAHEMGHYRKKHTLWGFMLSVAVNLLQFYLLSLILGNTQVAVSLGADAPTFALSVIAFGLLFTPVNLLTSYLVNTFSRRNEYQADTFAGENGMGESLIAALKKLSVKSLSNLTPDPIYVKFYYSHPTLLQRIANIRSKK